MSVALKVADERDSGTFVVCVKCLQPWVAVALTMNFSTLHIHYRMI